VCAFFRFVGVAAVTGECARMRLQHEHEIEHIGDEQANGEADAEQHFLANHFLGCKQAAERAGYGEADDGDQHHRTVDARGNRVVVLVVMAQATERERDATREQQICEDRAIG
jgi:hypothetical protein